MPLGQGHRDTQTEDSIWRDAVVARLARVDALAHGTGIRRHHFRRVSPARRRRHATLN